MDEWLSNHHLIQDVSLITLDIEIHNKGSTNQDLAICEEKRSYAGKILGKPRGFGRQYVGSMSP